MMDKSALAKLQAEYDALLDKALRIRRKIKRLEGKIAEIHRLIPSLAPKLEANRKHLVKSFELASQGRLPMNVGSYGDDLSVTQDAICDGEEFYPLVELSASETQGKEKIFRFQMELIGPSYKMNEIMQRIQSIILTADDKLRRDRQKEAELGIDLSPVAAKHQETQPEAEPQQPKDLLPESKKRNSFIIDGSVARICFGGRNLPQLKATIGMKHLAYLVNYQGQVFDTAVQLDQALTGSFVAEKGRGSKEITIKNADGQGFNKTGKIPIHKHTEVNVPLRKSFDRLKQIDIDMEKAQRDNDSAQLQTLQGEKEQILSEVKRLTAKSHRKTDYQPETKKTINKLRNSFNRAIDNIAKCKDGDALARHFQQNLFPFSFPFSYNPQPPIDWNE